MMSNAKSVLLKFLTSAVFLFLLVCGKLSAEITRKESFNHYSVTPKQGQSLLAAIKESTPLSKNNVTRFGGTKWSVAPQYRVRKLSGSCYVSQVDVQLDIQFTLPRLSPEARVSDSTRKKFDFFYEALLNHEIGHKNLGLEAANKIFHYLDKPTIFKSCRELSSTVNQRIEDIIRRYMALNHDYDLQTDYGRTQGAVLKDVILVE